MSQKGRTEAESKEGRTIVRALAYSDVPRRGAGPDAVTVCGDCAAARPTLVEGLEPVPSAAAIFPGRLCAACRRLFIEEDGWHDPGRIESEAEILGAIERAVGTARAAMADLLRLANRARAVYPHLDAGGAADDVHPVVRDTWGVLSGYYDSE